MGKEHWLAIFPKKTYEQPIGIGKASQLIIGKMQIQTMWYNFKLVRILLPKKKKKHKGKKTKRVTIREDMEKIVPMHTVGGSVK